MLDHISRILAASVLMTFGLVGCGTETTAPQTVIVSGKIFLDGKPLADADIKFIERDFTSTGRTNSEGYYELVMGAAPGDNKIVISKWKGGKYEINPEAGMDEGQFLAMQDPAMLGMTKKSTEAPQQLIPPRFSDPLKTEILYQVPEGGTESADFRITSH